MILEAERRGWPPLPGADLSYVTAGLDVRYLRPAPLHDQVELVGTVIESDEPQMTVEVELPSATGQAGPPPSVPERVVVRRMVVVDGALGGGEPLSGPAPAQRDDLGGDRDRGLLRRAGAEVEADG